MKKSIVALLLVVVMVIALVPVSALAANDHPVIYETEFNDSIDTATDLPIGTIGAGEIGSYYFYRQRNFTLDNDYYAVKLEKDVPYRVFVDGYSELAETTLIISLKGSDDKQIGVSLRSQIREDGYSDIQVTESGTYYIEFWNYFDLGEKQSHYYSVIVLPASSAETDPFTGADTTSGRTEYNDDTTPAPAPATSGFPDVTSSSVNATSYKAIYWAVDNGIVKGYSDGNFKPEVICTREQFSIMLWRFAGEPSANAGAINKFTDAGSFSNGAKTAVAWAVEQGIVQGFSDGSFNPKADITRAQVAVMLWRYAGQPGAAGSGKFSDIGSFSANVQKAIIWAEQAGIASGYKDGTFKPNDGCQRQHMAIFLYRFAN